MPVGYMLPWNLEDRGYPTICFLKTVCSSKNSKNIRCILWWEEEKFFKDPEQKGVSRFFKGYERINLRWWYCYHTVIMTLCSSCFRKPSFGNIIIHIISHAKQISLPPIFKKNIWFCFSDFRCYYLLSFNKSINKLSEHLNIQSYFYLDNFNLIKASIGKRFLRLASSVSKFTLISHHLFIIFYGSPNIFKAIFESSFP